MSNLKVGDPVPSGAFKFIGPEGVETVTTETLFSGRNVLLIGVVGAFTPVCTQKHLPDFMPYQSELRELGLTDEVVCVSAVDPFVMRAWSREMDPKGEIRMLTDVNAAFAEKLGLAIDLSEMGLGKRSNRYVMFARDGVIDILNVEASPNSVEETSGETVHKLLISG
ncbi:peroxiredoxin family protein [Aestuariispira insulae]|uniref:Glutathione-dependent peroxiredoxin n=1 Tax=Aestuariispira insulae TaxID=1461337 RepID=A0A3D9HXL0_9PROT|nr:peroxiredoxin [Aestuariispira insulae]RED54242.1 peroxiredoxin [Aestuariispira insulae]